MPQDGLPMMPGMNELVHGDLLRSNVRKCHTLAGTGKDMTTDVPRMAPRDSDTQKIREGSSAAVSQPQPAHLALDRKVLRFHAYFKEGVHESAAESARVRKCTVYYFLEDDSMCVCETKSQNSGMSQGTLIRRHQFPRPGGGGRLDFCDFRIGDSIEIYGKHFRLYACDTFTREFLHSQGIELAENDCLPEDEYTNLRAQTGGKTIGRRTDLRREEAKMDLGITGAAGGCSATHEEVVSTTQFLRNDRRVLRFKAIWDDRTKLNGDHRTFFIYFFLADDSIEVTEFNELNSGRDPFPSFLRRQRVLRQAEGAKFQNPRLSLNFRNEAPEYWSEDDLRIGRPITLFGRTFLPYDCDAFTKEYLMKMGVPEEELQPMNMKISKRPTPRPPTPPHNGFGEPDDSLHNCKRLANTRPVKSIKQFIDKSGSQLKFSMKLDSTDPTDKVRRFVLTYYLEDDTLSVFEPSMRNSGILGGKFLARQRVRLPPGDEYAKPQDFFVGAKIVVSRHNFITISTDERSINYMEQNSGQFDKSNVNTIVDKIRAMVLSGGSGLKSAFDAADTDGSGHLDFDELCGIFHKLGLPIVEQEVLTVLRYFDRDGDGQVSYAEFMSRLLPEGAATACSDDRPWEEICQEWAEKKQAEERVEEQDHARLRSIAESRASRAMQSLVKTYEQRTKLFQQQLRAACDSAGDGDTGKIGAAEFRRVVDEKMQLGIPAEQLTELCGVLFPPRVARVPYQEMLRLLESTSNYGHTAKTIGRFRAGGRGFRERP